MLTSAIRWPHKAIWGNQAKEYDTRTVARVQEVCRVATDRVSIILVYTKTNVLLILV